MTPPIAPAPWTLPQPLPGERRTPRLVLRFFTPEDAPSLVAALDADRAAYLPWLPWTATENRNAAEAIYTVEKMRRDRARTTPPPDDFTMGMFEPSTGEVVGGTGFHRVAHAAHEAEIGYWIRPDRRRQGLCTEAVAALISWGLTPVEQHGWGFRRLHIRCAGSNAASRRVPEKLGLAKEAALRKFRWLDGVGWDDMLAWSVLTGEWDITNARLMPASA